MNVNEVSRITGTKYKGLAVVEESLKLLEFSSLVLHTSLFSGYVQVLSRGSGSGSSGLILGPHDFSPSDCENDADLRILAIRTVPLSLHFRWGKHGLQPGKYARLNILFMTTPGKPPAVPSAIVLAHLMHLLRPLLLFR